MKNVITGYKKRLNLRRHFKALRALNHIQKEYQYLRALSPYTFDHLILHAFRQQGHFITPATTKEKALQIKAHVRIKNKSYPLFISHPDDTLDVSDIEKAAETCSSLQKRGLFIATGMTESTHQYFNQHNDVLESLTGQLLQDFLIAKPVKRSASLRHKRLVGYVLYGFIAISAGLYTSGVIYFALNGWNPKPTDITPWTIFNYLSYTHSPYGEYLLISLIAPFIMIGTMIGFLIFKPTDRSSHWATPKDLKKSRMLDKQGIVLGKYKGQYLRNNDPTHCFTFAPTGSGKGVGIVIPNLLEWPDSILCLDVKGENHELTSGYRASLGNKVINFTPYSEFKTSHCYNPFDYISSDPNARITDLQLIATVLISCAERADPHFPEEAQDLFIGLALYILDSPQYPNTIGAIFRLLGTEIDFKDLLPHIAQNFPQLHESARQLFNSYSLKAEKERSGIKSTLGRALKLWRNPVIDAVTSKSDFSFYDIRKRRHAIYFGVGVNHIDALAPLIRIFFEQAINVMTAHEPNPVTEPRKVLMLLDEIHILGPMKVMSKIFTLLRSYNVRIIGIVQNFETLDTIYSKAVRNTIIGNCAHRVFFACSGDETKRYVSQECGEEKTQSKSISRDKSGRKVSVTEKWIPLLKPHELGQLNENEEIILVEANSPIRCKKINYRFDKTYNVRTKINPVPTPKIIIRDQIAPRYEIEKSVRDDGTPVKSKKRKPTPQAPPHQEISVLEDDFSNFY